MMINLFPPRVMLCSAWVVDIRACFMGFVEFMLYSVILIGVYCFIHILVVFLSVVVDGIFIGFNPSGDLVLTTGHVEFLFQFVISFKF